MGLKGTELITAVEEAFGIDIPDGVSASIRTVGELHEQVLKEIQANDGSRRFLTHCFVRLRRALHAEFGCEAKELKNDTPLAEVIPLKERRKNWERLHNALDLNLPDLRKPRGVHLASLLVLGAGILSIFTHQEKAHIILLVCIVLSMAIGFMTERLRTRFPSGVETLGALASRVLSLNRKYIVLGGGSPSEVMDRLRELVAKHLGVNPEKVVPEARFVEDLGVG